MKAAIKILIVSIITALLIISAGCVSNDTQAQAPTKNPTPTAIPTPVQTFFPTENPTAVPVNAVFNVNVQDKYAGNVTNLMQATSGRNKVAKDGEYSYLLNFRITCRNTGDSDVFEFDPYEDVFLSVDGVNCKAKKSTKYPKNYNEIQPASLKAGDSISGWLYFIVPAGFAKANMNGEGMESNYVDLIYWN